MPYDWEGINADVELELPTPNPQRLLSDVAPTLPQAQGGVRGGTGLGPAPSPAPASPPPQPMAEPAPTGQFLAEPPPEEGMSENGTGSLTVNDHRYAEPGWTVLLDTILAGTMPWLMATVDVATGRVPSEQFDTVRMEHQQKLDQIKQEHPQFVAAAENAAPFITGLIGGGMSGAKTVTGQAGVGAVAGGAFGAAQGYTGADPELSSTDPDRLASAMGGAAKGAALGGAGGALAGGVQKGMSARADRPPSGPSGSSTVADTPENIAAKRVSQEARFEAQLQRDLAAMEAKLTKKPELPAPGWQQSQKDFLQDPISAWREQARINPSMDKWAEKLNLAPAAIARKLKAAGLPEPSSDNERMLRQSILDVTKKQKTIKEVRNMPPSDAPPPATSKNFDERYEQYGALADANMNKSKDQTGRNPRDIMIEGERGIGERQKKINQKAKAMGYEEPVATPKKPVVIDQRAESVMSQDYKAPEDMNNTLKRSMLPAGQQPEAGKVPKETKAKTKAPAKTKKTKQIDARSVMEEGGTIDQQVNKLVANGYDEGHARARLEYLHSQKVTTPDDDLAKTFRTKYDTKGPAIKGWQENRKAYMTDTAAFVRANKGDDLITLAAKVNMNPRVVAERLKKENLDDLPDALYKDLFDYDAAYKAAQKQAKKAKK